MDRAIGVFIKDPAIILQEPAADHEHVISEIHFSIQTILTHSARDYKKPGERKAGRNLPHPSGGYPRFLTCSGEHEMFSRVFHFLRGDPKLVDFGNKLRYTIAINQIIIPGKKSKWEEKSVSQ